MDDLQAVETGTADRAYEWTIRLLYAGLILGNALLVYDAWKESPSGIEWRARIRARVEKLRNCEGCARRREWLRKQTAHVLWEATEVVERAAAEGEGNAA